ncbi:GNAT family N-acetyltransferase [Mumia sp. Pv 4-285]|uniref:GNAT family N-acetyltransferase n=1 Tax=Mumia qirimensis TaxID=3234852 RepID=UPI00351CDF79
MDGLRQARADDLDAIVSVFLDCWTISYRRDLPAEIVDRITPESAHSLWVTALDNPALTVLVDIHDDDLVGVASYSMPSADEGYLASLYVDPSAQGVGVGRRLIATIEERLRESGATRATPWVFAANAPSIAFYEKRGWTLTGETATLSEWGQPQARMVKDL